MYVPSELRVIGKLTEDPVAVTYAAHDLGGQPSLLVSGRSPMNPGDLESFTRWAETLVACARHPYIADVVTHGVAEGRPYVAVRTGHRRTLAERIAASGPLPYEQVRQLGICLADGLATAHQAGLFHLAVRPEVIYFDDQLGPVLTGFDAAAPALVRPMVTGQLSAPETHLPRGAMDGRTPVIGAPADVYALAGTLYLALGGTLPDTSDDARLDQATGQEAADVLPDVPGVPQTLLASLRSAFVAAPQHRPTAAQLRDALQQPQTSPVRRESDAGDGVAAAVVTGMSGLSMGMVPPPGGASEPDQPEPRPVVPTSPPTGEETALSLETLAGNWRIVTGEGDQEFLVVDEQGTVTWSGIDEAGPFVATGEAVPLGGGVFRLLLSDTGGAAGFYVDLRLDGGGISFVIDETPADGRVDLPAE